MSATSPNPPRLKNAPAGRHPERLGRYAVIEYLAAGGMADLYLVRPDGQNGYAVCKRIAEHYSGIQRIVDLFIDEGRIAAQLTHPNIVQLFESGQADGQYYLAMEYIRGRDLVAIARRGVEVRHPMDTELAVALCIQVARGLVHAHEKVGLDGRPLKIVHCDISPGNIMVSWGGTAKIVDFGIARAEIQLREQNGNVAGKYNYMAPEQIRGEPIDGRADLFSLGVILYELTVGRRLFRGRPEEVMHKVLEAPIAKPTAVRPDYDPELERIVLAAIERDPEARTPSARVFHDTLSKWLWQRGKRVEKRAMAGYLRGIFSSEKVQEAEDYTAPAQLPSPASLVEQMAQADGALHLVDDDEPNDLPPPPRVGAMGNGSRAPAADATAAANHEHGASDAPRSTPASTADPQRVAPALALVLVGLSIGLVVYFLLLR